MSEMSALPIDISETTECSKIIENPNVLLCQHAEKCPYRDYVRAINTFSQNLKPPERKIHTFEKVNLRKMVEIKSNKESRFSFLNLLKFRRHEKDLSKEPIELYKINIEQNDKENIPNKLTFDLIHNIPKPVTSTVATNTSRAFITAPVHCAPCKNQENQSVGVNPAVHIAQVNNSFKPPKTCKQGFLNDKPTRVDVYYFDHGNACYLKTTDVTPNLTTELIAEKTEAYTTKFWAELFGTIHIFFAFLTTFILQFLKFILQSLIRPLTIGLLQLTSDYFFKPCLSVVFNAIIQPPAIFFFNILTSLRDLCDPVAEGVGYFLREVANVCRSIRLVEVKNNTNNKPKLNRAPCRRFRIRRKK
ncbi:uncharacterized protein [Onthophagus taurus]|nr:uncharacterized protein LOC111414817 isoform X2 [Onthophagus taurus]